MAPGGEVGSIGVLIGHQDLSGLYERMGVRTTLITSTDSPYKAERSPYGPLSNEARAAMKAGVDASHAAFVAEVAPGRRTTAERVNARFGRGRMVDAASAVDAGMADRVASLDAVIAELAKGQAPRPPRPPR